MNNVSTLQRLKIHPKGKWQQKRLAVLPGDISCSRMVSHGWTMFPDAGTRKPLTPSTFSFLKAYTFESQDSSEST